MSSVQWPRRHAGAAILSAQWPREQLFRAPNGLEGTLEQLFRAPSGLEGTLKQLFRAPSGFGAAGTAILSEYTIISAVSGVLAAKDESWKSACESSGLRAES